MKRGIRARATSSLIAIGTCAGAPYSHARAQNVAAWRSLGLGRAVDSLTTSTSECSVSEVRTRIVPRAVWALDKPFSELDFAPTKDAHTFVPKDDIRSALSSQSANRSIPPRAQRSVTYGVILEAGDATSTGPKPCTAAQASSIRVGHFAFLTIDIIFAHVRLEPYLSQTFQLHTLAPDELLAVVNSLADSLPASVFLQMRLASDLGDSLPGWDAIGRSVAQCNLGKSSACAKAVRDFSQSLQTANGVADVVTRLKRQTSLQPDTRVLGTFVKASPDAVKARLRSAEAYSLSKAVVTTLSQSVSPFQLSAFESIQKDVAALAKRLQAAPEHETDERSLEQKAADVKEVAEEVMSRERALLACEALQLSAWPLLERLLAPAPVKDCPASAQTALTLTSWHLGTKEDLNATAVPLLLWRKKVHVSEEMSKEAATPMRLLDLPLLEDVTVAGDFNGFLYDILERSGVRIAKE